MATIRGRDAYLYWNAAYVTEGMAISLKADRNMIEDTSFGDTNKTFQTGLSDFSLDVGRHYDQGGFLGMEEDAIAADPTARIFYMYPNRNVATDYWYGLGYVSLNSQGGGLADLFDEQYTIRPADQWGHQAL